MTYVPYAPLWCWALQGEDVMFFSQPTESSLCRPARLEPDGTLWLDTPTVHRFPPPGPCVARCQHETRFVLEDAVYDLEDPEPSLTPPIQCGRVARVGPDGRWLCDTHYALAWTCAWCLGPLPPAEQ